MVNLINQERAKAGLAPPLSVDLRLVELARKKSQDMIANNYFSHTSPPTYGDPFQMMTAAGLVTELQVRTWQGPEPWIKRIQP